MWSLMSPNNKSNQPKTIVKRSNVRTSNNVTVTRRVDALSTRPKSRSNKLPLLLRKRQLHSNQTKMSKISKRSQLKPNN